MLEGVEFKILIFENNSGFILLVVNFRLLRYNIRKKERLFYDVDGNLFK